MERAFVKHTKARGDDRRGLNPEASFGLSQCFSFFSIQRISNQMVKSVSGFDYMCSVYLGFKPLIDLSVKLICKIFILLSFVVWVQIYSQSSLCKSHKKSFIWLPRLLACIRQVWFLGIYLLVSSASAKYCQEFTIFNNAKSLQNYSVKFTIFRRNFCRI